MVEVEKSRRLFEPFGTAKNADELEGFLKTPTMRREAEPTFEFFSSSGF
jgi:hypothetical protein